MFAKTIGYTYIYSKTLIASFPYVMSEYDKLQKFLLQNFTRLGKLAYVCRNFLLCQGLSTSH